MTTLRKLPALTVVTAMLYGSGALLLIAGVVTWVPGKNPRWVITTLAVVAVAFLVYTLSRGRRFTETEGLVMIAAHLFTIGAMTWTTELTLGAYSNGTVLPVAGVYVVWFLAPVAGRVVLYLGCLWWFVAILHQGESGLLGFAFSLVVQTLIATEVFSLLKRRMDRLVRTDQLTGVLNRRGVTEVLHRELSRALKRRQDLSVVAIDLDGLRAVNNALGHTEGDRLLTQATRHWRDRLRRRDSIGRTGGDEFLLVLPGTTRSQAERIVVMLGVDSPGAWSAGVASAQLGDTVESLFDSADRRMYDDKAARRTADVPSV